MGTNKQDTQVTTVNNFTLNTLYVSHANLISLYVRIFYTLKPRGKKKNLFA